MSHSKRIEQFEKWARLIQAAQEGDKNAYREFLSEAYPFIQAMVRKKLGTWGDAEDVTQECLLGIHRYIATYDPSRNLRPWLMAIIRNKIVDYFRVLGRKHEILLDNEMEDVTKGTSEANQIIGDDSVNRIHSIIMKLPESLRAAVVLTKLEGLSYEEASKQEGISMSALRKRISRAYKMIGESVEQEVEASFGE